MGARLLAAAAAVAVLVFGVSRGTWAVGGSDSSCYALMAAAFARAELSPHSNLAVTAPWPDAARTLAPAGFLPSPTRSDSAAPICSPGFSLLLAPFVLVGGRDALFLGTPIAGALLVWLAFLFGRRLSSPWVGAVASVLVAAMPVFLFQVVQPMNDVATAAAWMAILVAATTPRVSGGRVGVLTGLALLVRPNLAPAALVLGGWLLRRRMAAAVAFALGAFPFGVVLLVLNHQLYGSPYSSGYGAADAMFALHHVSINVTSYGQALWQTQLGFPLLGLVAPLVAPAESRSHVWLTLTVAAATIAPYLFYLPFPEWWYLRFLLPALAPLTVLATVALAGRRSRRFIVTLVAAGVAAFCVRIAIERQAFDLWRLEQRFRLTGQVARDQLPDNAVFLTVWESGSVRYHAGREAILWDSLDPASLVPALAWLTARGLEPYIVIEDWEEQAFRGRFAASSVVGNLDWPPRFQIASRVRIFRPADRGVYHSGEHIPTKYVR